MHFSELRAYAFKPYFTNFKNAIAQPKIEPESAALNCPFRTIRQCLAVSHYGMVKTSCNSRHTNQRHWSIHSKGTEMQDLLLGAVKTSAQNRKKIDPLPVRADAH